MLDSYGREINYLRISVTDRCNLRCTYCMPPEGVPSLPHERILSFERMAEVAAAAALLGFDKVRLTGGEPLVRKGVEQLVSLIAAIPGIRELAMTTNGTLLAPIARDLAKRGLRSVNVSVDTIDPKRFAEITRGGRLRDALDGALAARDAGLRVKLNAVAIEGHEGDLEAVAVWAAGNGMGFQSIARYHLDEEKRDGGKYDRPPSCSRCNRLRLLSDGGLRPCLHGSESVPVDFADIEGSIRRAVLAKPPRGLCCDDLTVAQIGG
jgi:cyclic pyranopterin phosphate synthase